MRLRVVHTGLKVFAFALALGAMSSLAQAAAWKDEPVSIEVRHDNGKVDAYTGIPWSLRTTALDAMKMADGLKFSADWNRGISGWFIRSINGVASQGVGKKNWLMCVNGFAAGIRAGSYTLGPGAKVVWTYESGHTPQNCK